MRIPWGKVLGAAGLAGVAGVAASGALVVRRERQRRAYTADEVRLRLHERYADSQRRARPSERETSAPRPHHSSEECSEPSTRSGLRRLLDVRRGRS